jgi:hypothetical protein
MPLIAVMLQESGDANVLVRPTMQVLDAPIMPYVGLQYQVGTTQDGHGDELMAGIEWPSPGWRGDGLDLSLSLECSHETIDRERFGADRLLVGLACRPWIAQLANVGWREMRALGVELRVGAWFGDVERNGQPRVDEAGWYADLVLRPSPRWDPKGDFYGPGPWPFLQVSHDSLNGTRVEVLLNSHAELGWQLSFGYSWMRWGDGATATVTWRWCGDSGDTHQ